MVSATVSPALQWFGWWPFLVDALACYRIARVITSDPFPPTVRLRAHLDRLYGTGPRSLLWHCASCLGFWIAVLVVYLHTLIAALAGNAGHLIVMLVALPWAMAAVITLISDREPT